MPLIIEKDSIGLMGKYATDDINCDILGLALVGKIGDASKAYESFQKQCWRYPDGPFNYMASLLGIRWELAYELQRLHYGYKGNKLTAREIIEKLRQGEFFDEELGMSPEQARILELLRGKIDELQKITGGIKALNIPAFEIIKTLLGSVEKLLFQEYTRIEGKEIEQYIEQYKDVYEAIVKALAIIKNTRA